MKRSLWFLLKQDSTLCNSHDEGFNINNICQIIQLWLSILFLVIKVFWNLYNSLYWQILFVLHAKCNVKAGMQANTCYYNKTETEIDFKVETFLYLNDAPTHNRNCK